jgi:hypothetical protein
MYGIGCKHSTEACRGLVLCSCLGTQTAEMEREKESDTPTLTIKMYNTPLSIGHQLCHKTHPSSCSRTPLVNSRAKSRMLQRKQKNTTAEADCKHHASMIHQLLVKPREPPPTKQLTLRCRWQ